ncbi:hypothetical protein GCM10009805_13070 [Leucobacter chromiireducens subsp. solipictus]
MLWIGQDLAEPAIEPGEVNGVQFASRVAGAECARLPYAAAFRGELPSFCEDRVRVKWEHEAHAIIRGDRATG